MRKIIISLILFTLTLFSVIAQEMPSWVEMGMNISQIRSRMRMENAWMESPSPENIALGEFLYQFYKISGNEQGLYQFLVSEKDGLTSILITISETNFRSMIQYFERKYGEADYKEFINRGDEIPVKCQWFYTQNNLPKDIYYISVQQFSGGLFYIQYCFINYSDV